MPADIRDPGPNNTWPWFPRDAAGVPCWSDTHSAADVVHPTSGSAPVFRGIQTIEGRRFDNRWREANGNEITIPTVPVAELRAELGLA